MLREHQKEIYETLRTKLKKDVKRVETFEMEVDKLKNPVKYGVPLQKKKEDDWELFLSKKAKDKATMLEKRLE